MRVVISQQGERTMKNNIGYLIALADYLGEEGDEDGSLSLCRSDRKICAAALRHEAAAIGRRKLMRVAGISLMVALCAAGATAGLVLA
jgi:hypothetical protein